MTAAHKTLPFGTKVKVVEQGTGNSIVVTINDRGPFVKGRIIDLSRSAASELGFRGQGHTKVCIQRI
jgi:rare lipoprotein A